MTVASVSDNAFRIGEVISQSIQTTIRNIVPFGVVAIIAVVVIAVLAMFLSAVFGLSAMLPGQMGGGMDMAAFGASAIIGIVLLGLLTIAIYMLVVAAILYGAVQDLRGQPVSIGGLLSHAMSVVGPAVGTVIVLIGVWLAAEVVAFILSFIPILGPLTGTAMMVFLAISLWVTIPVAVVERPGPVASLQRSFALTSGNRWRILGIFLVVGVMFLAAIIVFAILAFVSTAIASILFALFYAGLFIFGAVLTAVGYYGLRVAKEGADIGDIARVFD